MEDKIKAKVYINPNYMAQQGSNKTPLKQHNTIHINQNFNKSNLQQNNANRIFINPNFVKARNECKKSANEQNFVYNQIKHTHTLHPNTSLQYDMLQSSSSNSTPFHDIKTSNVNIANKSRYSFVRTNNSQNVQIKNSHKNLQTLKEDTCQVKFTNTQSPAVQSKYNLLRKSDSKIPNAKTPQQSKLKINKYKVITVSNIHRYNVNVKKIYKSQHKTLHNNITSQSQLNSSLLKLKTAKPVVLSNKYNTQLKINKFSQIQLKRKSYQTAIENIKGKSKINNIPCPLFSKYGKCLRKYNGKCEYLHDRKHVSLCRTFLKGVCHDENCSLSHELSMKKMPTCYFYLKGMCLKDYCPYLHVKLSEKAKVCQDFLRGYCEKGENCSFRHVKSQLKRQLPCHVNISSNAVKKILTVRNGKSRNVSKATSNVIPNNTLNSQETTPDTRYYKKVDDEDPKCDVLKPTRCKLGTLPAFIQL